MDPERARLVAEWMEEDGYKGLVCRLPQNVMMLTGYWPVLGNTFCVLSLNSEGAPEVRLAVPSSEANLVHEGAAVEIRTFTEETLDYVSTTLRVVYEPLQAVLKASGLRDDNMGYEGDYAPVSTGYTQVGFPGANTLVILRRILPDANWTDATATLAEMSAIKTDRDVEGIRLSIDVARLGFEAARGAVRPDATEADVAAEAQAALIRAGFAHGRSQAYVHVMAGARAANAHKAFNLTTNAKIGRGDTVLVQMEVCVNGYWAELTRTFFAGDVSDEWARVVATCADAQDAALRTIRDGVPAREADTAAREVLRERGFGDAFKHGLGHGIGFQAINHSAQPVLHPVSETTLQDGMVHNMEPAVYLEGKGGFRLNDNVAVRKDGSELLSSLLPRDLDWLVTDTSHH